ncbi:unnamed protein product [Polarella glacialis]|uniref:Uncharacterized protein n=1 Tax=Polarella glacialis TaxID=89957 RepID=A0A813IDC7_POLGL|nr:unnamed protein product [Polarella glacialis]
MPTATGRHLLSTSMGTFLVVALFGPGGFNLLVSVIFTWIAMLCCRQAAGPAVFIGTMVYLLYLHVSNASGLAWKEGNTDYTGAQMIVTLKLTSAALNYADGEDKESLTDFQRAKALTALPSPLAFAGYALNPTALLSAPGCEMSDYLDWAERKGPWSMEKVPSAVLPTLRVLLEAFPYFGLYLALAPIMPESDMHADDAWAARPLWWRTGWLSIFMAVLRCRFYVAWKLAEAAMNASGLGFGGLVDGVPKWDRGTNVEPISFELATSAVSLPAHWNIQTGRWLRHYVYERVAGRGKKPTFLSLLITQIVSGVWHGLYAGYGLFFFFSAFMLQASKVLHHHQQRLSNWRIATAGLAVLHWFLVRVQINFLAEAFVLLEWPLCIRAWQRMQFLGLLVTFSLLAQPQLGKAHGITNFTAPIANNLKQEDMQHGYGVEHWEGGSTYNGQFTQGKKQGHGIYNWPDGSKYMGQWSSNAINGYGHYMGKDGREFRGAWREAVIHGCGEYSWPDGRSFCGQYADDQKHGFGVFTWKDGRRFQGFWQGGKQHGYGVTYKPDGAILRQGVWNMGRQPDESTPTAP